MPTPAAETEQPGVGAAAKQVAEHAEHARASSSSSSPALELKQKASAFGAGVGLGVGAAVVGLYAVGFLFATDRRRARDRARPVARAADRDGRPASLSPRCSA